MQQVNEPASQRVSKLTDPRFDLEFVERGVAGTVFSGKLHHFVSTDSTQTCALTDAKSDAQVGQVYVADQQTAGRGRGGHTWHSEPDQGLYLSVLVRPKLHATQSLLLSLGAGLAAQKAIEQVCGARLDLRWPNDLVTCGPNSRKIGGILAESAIQPDGTLRHAVIGFGINLNQRTMPPELADSSASLHMITGRYYRREAIATALLVELDRELRMLEEACGTVLHRFESASTWTQGKRVHVAESEGYTGTTDGLDERGLLRVRCDDGTRRIVVHGGVRELQLSPGPAQTTSREVCHAAGDRSW